LQQYSDDGINNNHTSEKKSDILLSQLVKDLEGGLPELKGEFTLSVQRVWRGMGRIAAKKVDVTSVYNHEAAPVPAGEAQLSHTHEHSHHHSHTHNHQHSSSNNNDATSTSVEVIKQDPHSNAEEEDNSHREHSHSHGHRSNEHSHHSHGHSHSQEHNHHHHHSHDDHNRESKLRNLPQITKMLQSASPSYIPKHVASLAIDAFTALAYAEMHTHGAESINQVHFRK
jgi:pyridinium-3,5-bisthiocarboxylic acid mononucleotide nickel chelatase